MSRRRKTPYQKICDAAERGGGCRLTFEDCRLLEQDHAISARAALDDEPNPCRHGDDGDGCCASCTREQFSQPG